MSTSQFQPYRTGWLTSPVRLAPNTTAATIAATATTEPPSVLACRTAPAVTPPLSAFLVPTTAAGGSPAAMAARVTADLSAPTPCLAGRTARSASIPSSPESKTNSAGRPAPRTRGSA
jgi:hypothetical protein